MISSVIWLIGPTMVTSPATISEVKAAWVLNPGAEWDGEEPRSLKPCYGPFLRRWTRWRSKWRIFRQHILTDIVDQSYSVVSRGLHTVNLRMSAILAANIVKGDLRLRVSLSNLTLAFSRLSWSVVRPPSMPSALASGTWQHGVGGKALGQIILINTAADVHSWASDDKRTAFSKDSTKFTPLVEFEKFTYYLLKLAASFWTYFQLDSQKQHKMSQL